MTHRVLAEHVAELPPAERLELIADVWDKLSDGDIPLTDDAVAELDRRLDAYAADGNPGSSWFEVRSRIERRP